MIYDTDVYDPEVAGALAWARCEDCGVGDVAMDMVLDAGGAWLCWPCFDALNEE